MSVLAGFTAFVQAACHRPERDHRSSCTQSCKHPGGSYWIDPPSNGPRQEQRPEKARRALDPLAEIEHQAVPRCEIRRVSKRDERIVDRQDASCSPHHPEGQDYEPKQDQDRIGPRPGDPRADPACRRTKGNHLPVSQNVTVLGALENATGAVYRPQHVHTASITRSSTSRAPHQSDLDTSKALSGSSLLESLRAKPEAQKSLSDASARHQTASERRRVAEEATSPRLQSATQNRTRQRTHRSCTRLVQSEVTRSWRTRYSSTDACWSTGIRRTGTASRPRSRDPARGLEPQDRAVGARFGVSSLSTDGARGAPLRRTSTPARVVALSIS